MALGSVRFGVVTFGLDLLKLVLEAHLIFFIFLGVGLLLLLCERSPLFANLFGYFSNFETILQETWPFLIKEEEKGGHGFLGFWYSVFGV